MDWDYTYISKPNAQIGNICKQSRVRELSKINTFWIQEWIVIS